MGLFKWEHLVLLLVVAFFLFGAKRLPEIARSFGKSIQEFKKGLSTHPDDQQKKDDPPKQPPAA